MSLTIWVVDAAQMTPFYNLAVCSALSQSGCNVTYIATRYLYTPLDYPPHVHTDLLYFRGIDGNWIQSFPLLRKVLRGLFYPFGNLQLFQKIKSERPDIIHFQWARLPRFDLPLIKAIQKLGIPVIYTVHDVVPLSQKTKNIPLDKLYRQCDGLIVHSLANKKTLLKEVNDLDADKIFIIPHIELQFPNPSEASREQARSILNLPEDASVVLFFGNIKAYKGIDILLQVIRQMNSVRDDIYWLIVGKADPDDQQTYVDEIKTLDRTCVVDYFVPHEDVWIYHLAADIVVFPYRHIYQSGALITAMRFGLPAVVTDVGSFAETIDGNGLVVPPEDPQAFANAINEILSDSEKLQIMGQQSRQIIDDNFGSATIARQHIDLYQSLIKTSEKQSL